MLKVNCKQFSNNDLTFELEADHDHLQAATGHWSLLYSMNVWEQEKVELETKLF